MAEKISPVMLLNNVKAFVKFSGVGTPSIHDGFNVSGITDNGTGRQSVVFAEPMKGIDYTIIATCSRSGATNGGHVCREEVTAISTTVCPLRTGGLGSTSISTADRDEVHVLIMEVS